MHPILLLLPTLASSLHVTIATNTTEVAGCSPATCGNLTITYPFWLSGLQAQDCGYPAFELTCESGNRTLFLKKTFKSLLYRVTDIFYDNSSLAVVDANVNASACYVPDLNVSSSLSLFPFNISRLNKELFFLYNCTHRPASKDCQASCAAKMMYTCLGGNFSNDGDGARAAQGNCSVLTVPVRRDDGADAEKPEKLMKYGFLLEWGALGNCSACNQSGGRCMYDDSKAAFQCLCSDGTYPARCDDESTKAKSHKKFILIVSMAIPTGLLLACLFVVLKLCRKEKLCLFILGRRNFDAKENIEKLLAKYGSLIPKRYKYSEIKKITRSFEDKLGEGGYGMVYKGSLQDGRLVAVKFLHDSKGNGEEFVNEVVSIGRISHVNIVSLLGFCLEGSKQALVYEYMPNGSLEKYIYSEDPKTTLGWEKLYEIAIGISRGLEYLHRGCNMRIIHFDIKPHNILLDQEYCPKIADFGLAKLCNPKESILSMADARGTIGFIAPEVFSRSFGVVSTKSDVYSFGMMLLEMVGGRRNVKANVDKSSQAYFPHWVYDHLAQHGRLEACEVTSETEEIARKMALVGLWCIQTMPENRPSISRVLKTLERSIDELEMPPRQCLSCPSDPSNYFINSTSQEDI